MLLGCFCTIALFDAQAATPDLSGAWRLDDQHSDSTSTLTALLRTEARREQPAALPSNAPAAAPNSASGSGHYGGGMGHGGGRGGGGMGGGSGGGHGGHHGSGDGSTKTASSDQDPLAHAQFALPPLQQIDSVLLVQQQDGSIQIQLDNGEKLTVKLDGQARQSLNGDAMVQGHAFANGVRITIHFADGRQLDQEWVPSTDGRHLIISGQWKLPSLQQPVYFRRSYLAVS